MISENNTSTIQKNTSLLLTHVIKRTGETQEYNKQHINTAIYKAFTENNIQIDQANINTLTNEVEQQLNTFHKDTIHIEKIQDTIEEVLMKKKFFQAAKYFIIYRQKHAEERLTQSLKNQKKIHTLSVKKKDGTHVSFDSNKIINTLKRVSKDIDIDKVSLPVITHELERNIFNGISTAELEDALILSCTAFIERHISYDTIAKRLLLQKIYKKVIPTLSQEQKKESIQQSFITQIKKGVEYSYFSEKLLEFDLELLSKEIEPKRDEELKYLGLQTLCDRYFVSHNETFIETPQTFWMRIAMGLALNESEKEKQSINFYNLMSQLYYIPSTPTLFHSGTLHPQLSSCYISTVSDNLHNIFKCIGDNAQMAKWSGGIGNDWTPVRATNSLIKSTNVKSQGVIPFLKIANDTTLAINRSGKRRGATCAYLETWHLDIEHFLDLRRNTGDERRRTHDMNTAIWIPDLFMKRVLEEKEWTLFSPSDVPDIHDSYGKNFEEKYIQYEEKAQKGEFQNFKKIDALILWRKILSRLFETGHPWITFKDPCNIRSPQDHVGVVHSSNLCTEITLNNSKHETAVCNLGSINLKKHCNIDGINQYILSQTVKTAIRMLDNVIDINFYPTIEAKNSNFKHRPIGLGLMGIQDALFMLQIPFDHSQALEFVDSTMEYISYHAILSSSELAKERGSYESFKNSKWDRGLLPYDTIKLLEQERGIPIEVNRNSSLNWEPVRLNIQKYGMRNSNTMAIAPTATISNIAGCFPCIEPIYKNIYVKSNMSGEFTILNNYLVQDLQQQGLWSQTMLDKIKYYDGNINFINEIPQELKTLYKEVFDIDPLVLLRLTATRSKWIDQSQSHNIFLKGVSGKRLHDTYIAAWKMGLKTTYYLRSLAATQIEKSTLDAKEFGYTQKRKYDTADTSLIKTPVSTTAENNEETNPHITTTVKENITKNDLVNNIIQQATQKSNTNTTDISNQQEKINEETHTWLPKIQQNNSSSIVTSDTICNLLDPECESCQ